MNSVTFYDPHPGLMGCPVRLPEHLRITAEWLDGQEMTTDEAVKCFEDATPERASLISVKVHDDWIGVTMGSIKNLPMHAWRVIRFKRKP